MANGDTTLTGYNGRGQVMSRATGMGGTTLAQFAVANVGGYDAVGNRLSVAASVTGMTGQTAYSYDNRNELTAETSTRAGDAGGSYAYDGAENPTKFRGQSVGAASADNQLPGSTFDGDGNPTGYNGSGLTFDPQGRMTSYNGGALTCGYREDGLRALKQSSNGRTYFLYDGNAAVCELNSSGAVIATNTRGADGLISRRTSANGTFYDFDLSGNVAQRLSSSGPVASTDVDDAFGNRTTNDAANDPFGFGAQWGYYADNETELLLLQHRFYDPVAGRFITRDPIGYRGGTNLYGYCHNDAPNVCDTSGYMPGVPIRFPPGSLPPVANGPQDDDCSPADCDERTGQSVGVGGSLGIGANATYVSCCHDGQLHHYLVVAWCWGASAGGGVSSTQSLNNLNGHSYNCSNLGGTGVVYSGSLGGPLGGTAEYNGGTYYTGGTIGFGGDEGIGIDVCNSYNVTPLD